MKMLSKSMVTQTIHNAFKMIIITLHYGKKVNKIIDDKISTKFHNF